MARAWSLDGRHLNFWGESGAGPPVPIKQRISSGEQAALFHHPGNFDSLHRKNDFLTEGVHTVFGVKDGEAHLQGFSVPADQFTPVAAKEWLQEGGLKPFLFIAATDRRDRSTVEFCVDGQQARERISVMKDIIRRVKSILCIVNLPLDLPCQKPAVG